MDDEDLFLLCGLTPTSFCGVIDDTESDPTVLPNPPALSASSLGALKSEVIIPSTPAELPPDVSPDMRQLQKAPSLLKLEAVKATIKSEVSGEVAALFNILPKADDAISGRFGPDELPGLDAFVVDGILEPEECESLIELCERTGSFSFWSQDDTVSARSFRNADTIEMTNATLAHQIWLRLEPFVRSRGLLSLTVTPDTPRFERDIGGIWDAYSTNSSILFSKYSSGGHFAPHTDGYSVVDLNQRSMFSIILYLNDCGPGPGDGGTRFFKDEARGNLSKDHEGRFTADPAHEVCTVQAVRGRCLVFYHNHLHEGTPPVTGSSKYILRSDLMYQRRDAFTAPEDLEAFRLYSRAVDLAGISGREKEALPLFQRAFKMSLALAKLYGM